MDLGALQGQMAQLNASYVDPTTKYTQTLASMGGDAAQQRVSSLSTALQNNENLITGLPANILQRTQNSDVTAGQNARLNAMEVAPLNQTETNLGTQKSNAQTDFNNIQTGAKNAADLYQTGFTTQQSNLQQQIANAQAAAAAAEQQRQFNVQQAAAATAAKSGGSGSSKAAAPAPAYQQRASDKGYNFQNAGGQGISARLYAQLTGTDFNALLRTMASNGDVGAKDVLAHGASSQYYHALTWD